MSSEAKNVAVKAARVAAGDTRGHYDGFAILLHWTTVVLVLVQFGLAQLWAFSPKPLRHRMIVAHMSVGVVFAAVIAVRLVWRLTPGHRVRSASSGPTEWLASGVHGLLYLMLAAEAVLGFLLRWSGGEEMSLFGLAIPAPFEAWSKPAHHWVGEAHEWNGWAIVLLAAGHALAALAHHFWLGDDVLWRMLPGARAREMTERAPSPERAAGP